MFITKNKNSKGVTIAHTTPINDQLLKKIVGGTASQSLLVKLCKWSTLCTTRKDNHKIW
ncbi:MAG: hypothetical protein Q4A55_07115 [Aerococcus sp.]|nr:hypothetical protein [Aerococcus sp.]